MDATSGTSSFVIRTLVDTVLAAHLVVAGVYWWFCPKVFPLGHVRFWLNSMLPPLVVAACVALIVLHRRRRDLAALAIICISFLWAAATVLGSVLFPISLRGCWGIGLAAVLVGVFFSSLLVRRAILRPQVWLPCLLTSAATGGFAIWAQLPPPATTHPLDEPLPKLTTPGPTAPDAKPFLSPYDQFDPRFGQLLITRGTLSISCQPQLDFDRVSPDGFWSLLSPPKRTLRGHDVTAGRPTVTAHALEENIHTFQYDDGSVIVLPVPISPKSLDVTSYSRVEHDTFSHLNAYCSIGIGGHKKLSLSFSPTGSAQIDVLPYDYPTGRAARFAFFDEPDKFYVVEGASGEKGPFHLLASGPLRRGDPLTITLHDAGQPVASITLDDWSQQVSTGLSPTAGWRVPMNAIEFQRIGDSPSSPCSIYITLAATSVGRGWDTVGHRAGVYRNRLHFEFESQDGTARTP